MGHQEGRATAPIAMDNVSNESISAYIDSGHIAHIEASTVCVSAPLRSAVHRFLTAKSRLSNGGRSKISEKARRAHGPARGRRARVSQCATVEPQTTMCEKARRSKRAWKSAPKSDRQRPRAPYNPPPTIHIRLARGHIHIAFIDGR